MITLNQIAYSKYIEPYKIWFFIGRWNLSNGPAKRYLLSGVDVTDYSKKGGFHTLKNKDEYLYPHPDFFLR
jgi:hypothetical protein